MTSGSVTCSGVQSGKKYVVYSMQDLTDVQKLSVKSTTFPSYFTAYMETKDKTENGDEVLFRMIAYKCAPQTEVNIEFSNTGDPATLSVTCDLRVDEDDNLLDMILADME